MPSAGATTISTGRMTQEDVNRVLATIGYRPGRNAAGIFGWLMKPTRI